MSKKRADGIYGPIHVDLSPEDQQVFVGVLIIVAFGAMAFEIAAPEVVFLVALVILMLAEILTITETLSGFSNDATITIGVLFLVIGVVEKSHLVDWLARKTFGSGGSFILGKARMFFTCFALSIFFNNTPLVAILLPVVKDWARMRNESASQLLMPLSFSVLAGSFVSMIGTSTNLTVQGLVQADRGYSFSFFAPAPIGVPLFFILLVYQLIAGPYLLPNDKNGLIREARDKAESMVAEVFVSEHSPAVGKSVGDMMSSLGIASSRAIKIRRRVVVNSASSDDLRKLIVEESKGEGKADGAVERAILDLKYVKRSTTFWVKSLVNPSVRHVDYDSSRVADLAGREDVEGGNDGQRYRDIVAPTPDELIGAGDIVFIASAVDTVAKMMKSVAGESHGLFILKSNVLAMAGFGTELIECVVSDTNYFLGKKVSEISKDFSEHYKASLITVRGKDWGSSIESMQERLVIGQEQLDHAVQSVTVGTANHYTGVPGTSDDTQPGQDSALTADDQVEKSSDSTPPQENQHAEIITVSDHVLSPGDLILAVCPDSELDNLHQNRDFYVVSTVGSLPKPLNWFTLIPPILFLAMLILVATEEITIIAAVLVLASVFFIGGWLKPEEISKLVDLNLLMLLACGISFARGITNSGLAEVIAKQITNASSTPFGNLLLVMGLTVAATELISNNAAAALMYPIAVAIADNLGVDFRPFAMGVLIGATTGFMSPIGKSA